MRYRRLDSNGDYVFGHGAQDFLVNTPETVGQAVLTAMKLILGEYFADTSRGVDYNGGVLGRNTGSLYDQVLKSNIQAVQGVLSISNYTSNLDTDDRLLSVTVTIHTIYGAPITITIPIPSSGGGYGVGPYGDDYGA